MDMFDSYIQLKLFNYLEKTIRIGFDMTANNDSEEFQEIQSIFEELNLETFEKRNKFLKYKQEEEVNDPEQYLSTTTVTTRIN